MAETMRCPKCGASNPVTADWCGQCLTRFGVPEPAPAPPAAPDSPAPAEGETMASAAVGTTRGAFTVTEEGIVWTCRLCESQNPIELQVCSVCGASFAETVSPTERREAKDGGTAALISLFMPGAGHAWVGLWGQAVARAILSLLAIAVFLALAVSDGLSATALLFALIAMALWAVSAHDAYRAARLEDDSALLKGRAFLWTVLGILTLLMIVLTVTGLTAR